MTHVSRKRQSSDGSEAKADAPKKKKLNEEPNGPVETQAEVSEVQQAKVPETSYTAKLFKLELMYAASWLSALEKFHDAYVYCEAQEAKDGEIAQYDIVLEYFRLASEGFTEILQYVDVRHKRTELALCFQVLCDILQRVAAKTELSAYLGVAERIARIVLTRHVQALWFLMSNDRGKSKSYQIKVAVRFLSACVSLNDELARFTWERMGSFADRIFQTLLHRTDLADAEDVRMCTIQLILSFLLSEDTEFLTNVLSQATTFTNMFSRLRTDKFATLVLVLSTLIERVIRNDRVPLAMRRRFFNAGKPSRIDQIAALADWRGPQRSEFWNLHDRRKAHLEPASQSDVMLESDDRIRIVRELAQTLLDELNAEPNAKATAAAQPHGGPVAPTERAIAVTADLSVEAVAEALLENEKKRRRFVKHVNTVLETGTFRKQKHANSLLKHVPSIFATGLVFRSTAICNLLETLLSTTQGDTETCTCIVQTVREHLTAKNAKWVTALLTRAASQRSVLVSLIRLVLKARKHADAQVCFDDDRRDGALYLCAYGASLAELDCVLFELLCHVLQDERVRESLRPYLWGVTAVNHFRVERDRAHAESAAPRSASLDSLVLAIDAPRLLRTCLHFPMHLPLNDHSQFDAALVDLYDPRFLLTAFADLLRQSHSSAAMNDFVDRHCLSLAITALSSYDASMRQLGCVIVARFAAIAKKRESTVPRASAVPERVGRNAALVSWREEVRFLVDLLRCALVGAANESESGGESSGNTWNVTRVPFVIGSFFVRAIELIVNDPENELYRRLYERLLDERAGTSWKRLLSNTNPSLFLATFICECAVGIPSEVGSHAKAARAWALQLLAGGLREPLDYHVIFAHAAERHNQLLSVLLATLTSSMVDDRIRSLTVETLLRVIDTCTQNDDGVLLCILFHLRAQLCSFSASRLREHFTRIYLALWTHLPAQHRTPYISYFRALHRLLATSTLPSSLSEQLALVTQQLQQV